MRYMKLKKLIYIYCVSCLLLISCSEQSVSGELGNRPKEQSFTVAALVNYLPVAKVWLYSRHSPDVLYQV